MPCSVILTNTLDFIVLNLWWLIMLKKIFGVGGYIFCWEDKFSYSGFKPLSLCSYPPTTPPPLLSPLCPDKSWVRLWVLTYCHYLSPELVTELSYWVTLHTAGREPPLIMVGPQAFGSLLLHTKLRKKSSFQSNSYSQTGLLAFFFSASLLLLLFPATEPSY